MFDLLPFNATAGERALSEATARLGAVSVPLVEDANPDTCAPRYLPWLAWAYSVDAWDINWTEAQQRAAVKSSVRVHRVKGTVGALKEALGSLGYDLGVTEWHQLVPMGAPYTFRCTVTVDQEGIPTLAAFSTIVAVANSAKNVRSQLLGVDVAAVTRATVHVGAAAIFGEIITISAEPAP